MGMGIAVHTFKLHVYCTAIYVYVCMCVGIGLWAWPVAKCAYLSSLASQNPVLGADFPCKNVLYQPSVRGYYVSTCTICPCKISRIRTVYCTAMRLLYGCCHRESKIVVGHVVFVLPNFLVGLL